MSNLKGKVRAYHEGRLARERKRLSKDPGKKRLTGDLKEHAESVYDKNLIAAPAGKEISNSRYWDTLDQIGSGKLSTREAVSSYLHKKGSVMSSHRKRAILEKLAAKRDSRLESAGVSGYNQPRATPSHPTKSHIVVAKVKDRIKTIRFGQQGVKTNQTKGQREAYESRHAKSIAKNDRLSASYWSTKVKWSPGKTKDKKNQKWVKGS